MTVTEMVLVLAGLVLGVVKTGFGGGVGVVVAPILALVMPAKESLGVLLPLILIVDAVSAYYYRHNRLTEILKPLVPGAVVGLLLGWFLLGIVPEAVFRKLLGGLACAFVALQPFTSRFTMFSGRGRLEPFLAGALLGCVSIMTHAGGMILMMYLLPRGLSGQAFVATAVTVGAILNAIKAGPYVSLGLVNVDTLSMGLWMIPSAAVGMVLGVLLNRRLPRVWFHRAILTLVLIVGLRLVLT